MPTNQNEQSLEPPSASLGDKAYAVVRAGLGAIPFAGTGAIELFSAIVTPPLERRRDEWMGDVGERLAQLAVDGTVNLDTLQKNDAFIDLVMSASQAAVRNANDEKRTALRNAIENAALGCGIEESLQHMFIRWVDELTVWHLRILKLFQNPKVWADHNQKNFNDSLTASLSYVLEQAYPDMQDKRGFYDQAWRDLHQRGLVTTDSLHSMMTGHGLMASRTTESSNEFLRFIEEPEES